MFWDGVPILVCAAQASWEEEVVTALACALRLYRRTWAFAAFAQGTARFAARLYQAAAAVFLEWLACQAHGCVFGGKTC